jgi:Sec-independent protein translocase protein TatA
MFSNTCVRWIVVLVCVLGIFGCARKNPPATGQEQTKTAAEYKAEADKQINEQNMSQELSKLEQEVAADANQP